MAQYVVYLDDLLETPASRLIRQRNTTFGKDMLDTCRVNTNMLYKIRKTNGLRHAITFRPDLPEIRQLTERQLAPLGLNIQKIVYRRPGQAIAPYTFIEMFRRQFNYGGFIGIADSQDGKALFLQNNIPVE